MGTNRKDPCLPDGWQIIHDRGLRKSKSKVVLFWSKKQTVESEVPGLNLSSELSRLRRPLSSADLTKLLKRPEQISEDWQGRRVCFWGTIFVDQERNYWIRVLFYWTDSDPKLSRWEWAFRPVKFGFGFDHPAAIES